MTPNQLKAIEYFLWKRPDEISQEDWITFDQWKLIRDQITYGTASDLIETFQNGNHSMAINQIKHLLT